MSICRNCRKPIELRRDKWTHIQTSGLLCDPVFTHAHELSDRAAPL